MKTRKLKLKSIKKSHLQNKKWDATFVYPDGHTKVVPFGARQKINNEWVDMSDFTKHKDETRKQRYIKRHSGSGEKWDDPVTPGALSYHILWNKPSFRASVSDFKKRFDL
jgi:ribosomal protein S4